MNFSDFLTTIKTWALTTGIKIILIVIITLILIKVIKVVSSRLSSVFLKKGTDEESEKRAKTLASVIQNFLIVLVIVVAAITIIGQLGIEIAPLLATAGIAGVAIGFAGQSLIKDIINGFFLLLWDQIRVGDYVQLSDKRGLVEMINLKMTIIRDFNGNVHYIPNGSIDVVTGQDSPEIEGVGNDRTHRRVVSHAGTEDIHAKGVAGLHGTVLSSGDSGFESHGYNH